MKFLHQPFQAKANQIIRVDFDQPTKVLLIHSSEFNKYKKGQTYNYRGGDASESPVEFEVPFDGKWHAIIEKGSYRNPLQISGSAKLLDRHKTLNGTTQMETHQEVQDYDDTLE